MKKKHPGGRPRKLVKEINPQVQIGRHPQAEIDAVDAAAAMAGKTRSRFVWDIVIREINAPAAKR